jgi:ABC-type Na+ efflux pump permease subunit
MDSEILDDVYMEKKVVLLSKISILIIGLLVSPLLAGILYCYNLFQANKKDKIFSTLIAIVTINFMATVPIMGFKIFYANFDFSLYIHHFITTSLIVMPLWKKHFKNVEFQTNFPISAAIMIIVFILGTYLTPNLIFILVNIYLIAIIIKFLMVIVKALSTLTKGKHV